jgi:protein gp37
MGKTNIQWTNETWNPITGCSKVSPGCAHCYAESLSLRYGWSKQPWLPQYAAENVVLHPERLEYPIHWRKSRMVFVNSMSDLFHEQVPDEFIAQVFRVMLETPRHTYQILTKRPERMLAWRRDFWPVWSRDLPMKYMGVRLELPNIWLGVSVENQHWADVRVPLLLQTPAAVRFLSCEPLLSPVDLTRWIRAYQPEEAARDHARWEGPFYTSPSLPLTTIDWVIAGGESGPKHRPMDLDWARSLRDQCQVAGVSYFFKQVGGATPKSGGDLLDGVQWHQMPHEVEGA